MNAYCVVDDGDDDDACYFILCCFCMVAVIYINLSKRSLHYKAGKYLSDNLIPHHHLLDDKAEVEVRGKDLP